MKRHLLTSLLIILIFSGCHTSRQPSASSGQSYAMDKTGKLVKIGEFKYIDGKVLTISHDKIIIVGSENYKRNFTIDNKTEIVEWPGRRKVSISEIREGDQVRISFPLNGQNNALVIQKNFPR
jgi:Cu/Ag efflux protein CusF